MKSALLILTLAFPTLGPAPSVPKISLSESVRYETMTKSGGDFGNTWSETQTASRTKLAIAAEAPIDGVKVDGETMFEVQTGDFRFAGRLKDDAAYRPGASSARLSMTLPADAKGVRTVVAKVDLKWADDRLTAKIAADSPNAPSVAAMAFKDSQIGPFEATTKAWLAFGGRKFELDVPLRGKIGRKTVDVPGLSGGVTTIDLKGEAKATAQ